MGRGVLLLAFATKSQAAPRDGGDRPRPAWANEVYTSNRRFRPPYLQGSKYSEAPMYSSILAMTYFLLEDSNILPKKELHRSFWVCTCGSNYLQFRRFFLLTKL